MTKSKNTFIQQLFQHIANDQYVLLKWLGTDLKNLPEESDLDMLVEEDVAAKIAQFIQSTPDIELVKQEKKLDATHYYLHFKNGDFLQLDLLSQLMRKQSNKWNQSLS